MKYAFPHANTIWKKWMFSNGHFRMSMRWKCSIENKMTEDDLSKSCGQKSKTRIQSKHCVSKISKCQPNVNRTNRNNHSFWDMNYFFALFPINFGTWISKMTNFSLNSTNIVFGSAKTVLRHKLDKTLIRAASWWLGQQTMPFLFAWISCHHMLEVQHSFRKELTWPRLIHSN